MTAKEKAKELVENYYGITDVNFGIKEQKKCALIYIDDLISVLDVLASENKYYYLQVKEEIENL